ncbi:MAG: HugZ family protein [Thiotrichales bacterium]
MTDDTGVDLDAIRAEYECFPANFESVLMATCGADGLPNASYAAYIHHDSYYYIYVSELARHTQNLLHTGKASLLFIENEHDSGHLFARRRVTFDCDAVEVARETSEFAFVLDKFHTQFGKLMETLRNLQDFHLFRILPRKGMFVKGFARAFVIEPSAAHRVSHVRDAGHRPADAATEQAMSESIV